MLRLTALLLCAVAICIGILGDVQVRADNF